MLTLEALQAEYGVDPTVRTKVAKVAAVATPRAPRGEDMRCPKCKMVKLTADERCTIVPYQRSVCTGTNTCGDCGGTANGSTVFCEKCRDKGYVLKFEKKWFNYACSACVYELRTYRGKR